MPNGTANAKCMKNKKSTQFNCFSPPVMVATLIIEVTLAIYTIWRYKMSVVTRLIVTALLMLATFQLAEYFVCTGRGISGDGWSRLGFMAITTLPTLGLHIIHVIAGKPVGKLVKASYLSMAAIMLFFLTYSFAFEGHQCTGNYVIFQMGSPFGGLYLIYYYALLLVGIVLGLRWANELKILGTKTLRQVQATRGMVVGYLVFMVPTITANALNPSTLEGLPSIMCGFAVIFAVILGFYVLPRAADRK